MTNLLTLLLIVWLTRIQGCFHEIHEWDDDNTTATFLSHISETDSDYILSAELPEVNRKDLQVDVDYNKRQLDIIKGGRDGPRGSTLHRSWFIDATTDIHDLTMAFTNGVVTVSIPKSTKKSKIRGAAGKPIVESSPIFRKLSELLSPLPLQPIHAPRIAEMSEIDEEFEYWYQKM